MMSQIEKAKLYHISDPVDKPKQGQLAMDIQFNPNSLKVALANSIKENERNDSGKAAQFIDKSSSTLSVELIFDTTDQYGSQENEGANEPQEVRKDVRSMTGIIAREFMYSKDKEDGKVKAKRCMFAWGTFSFIGIMESFDETLDYFSPEGTPLRATVALKLKESRFQFNSEEAKQARRDTPTLFGAPDRGEGNHPNPKADALNDSIADANAKAGKDEKDWRSAAMYNGKESPRLPSNTALSIPTAEATASLSASVSVGGGISAGFGAGISASTSMGLGTGARVHQEFSTGKAGGLGKKQDSLLNATPPAFNFGLSAALGTGIPGAFSANFQAGEGLSAGSIVSGGATLHGTGSAQGSDSLSSKTDVSIKPKLSLGFE